MILSAAWFNYRKVLGKVYRVIAVTALCGGLGALVGMTQAAAEKGHTFSQALDKMFPTLLYIIVGVVAVLVLPMVAVSVLRNKQYEMLTAKLEVDADRQRMARELSEARLRVLSAQIEPHFLFNTLGAVQQLAEQGAPRAAELTAHLIAFLRASLDEMRTERVTLKKDFALIQSYLEVMKARLGSRLDYELTLPMN
jgi:sensor histidine kinase YesM